MVIRMKKALRKLAVLLLLLPLSSIADNDIKEIDLSQLSERGMLMRILTDGRPIWVVYRTNKALKIIEEHSHINYPRDPDSIIKEYRSYNKDYFVVFGGCPKKDELPAYYPDKGFVCQSNCAAFDMAGRPTNKCLDNAPMDIPAHYFE